MGVGGSASLLPQKGNADAAVQEGYKIVINTYLIMYPKWLDDCASCSCTIVNFLFDPLDQRVKNHTKLAHMGPVTFIYISRIAVLNI